MPTTTNYIWDEENLLAEADGTNAIQTMYTNEPEQYGNLVSTRLPVAGTPTTVYHHFDAIGSTRQLTNTVGGTTDTMIYDAWGNVVNRTGTTQVAFLWIGEVEYYFDLETGLVSVRERIYEPVLARWASADPLGFADGRNRFVYVSNRPSLFGDPSGLYAVQYQGGRGVFTIATIHDNCTWSPPVISQFLFPGLLELSDVGSIVNLAWRPRDPRFGDPANPFGPVGCCLCDDIRFVQIINTTVATSYWWANLNQPWHVDSGIPYPFGNSCMPCAPAVHATLFDDPGRSAYRLYVLAEDGEACATCMTGREGILSNYPNIYVYGCIKWSHSFTKEAPTDSYDVLRQIGPRIKRGKLFDYSSSQSDIVNVDYIGGTGQGPTAGSAPSARFINILSNYTVIPGWLPGGPGG
jgi:RHS repeat-associated protein